MEEQLRCSRPLLLPIAIKGRGLSLGSRLTERDVVDVDRHDGVAGVDAVGGVAWMDAVPGGQGDAVYANEAVEQVAAEAPAMISTW